MAMKYYNLRQTAEILCITIRTARQWIHDGKMKAVKLNGSNRCGWRVSEDEILRIQQGSKDSYGDDSK